MINIWCKKLRPIELLAFWWKSLFVPVTVRYDEYVATPTAQKLLALAQRAGLCRSFLPANLDFGERDESGNGLIYLVNKHLTLCCENFLKQHSPTADERYRQMVKTYIRGYLEGQILFITYAEARIRRIGTQNNLIVVEPGLLNSILTAFYAGYGVSVKTIFNFAEVFRAWLVPPAYVVMHVIAKMAPRVVKGNVGAIRPSVWLEYCDSDRNELGFWIKHVNTSSFDIVYYFDRSDTPVTETRTTTIEKRGLKWIDAHCLSLFQLGNVPLRVLVGLLLRAISPGGGYPPWFRAFQFQERMWYLTYLSVFTKFQVKVLIQHQDRGWLQAVQAHAIEDAGGIMVGYHWSHLHFTMDNWFLNSQHVYFVWGQSMYDNLQQKGHTSRHILPSGIWLKPTSEERPPQVDELSKDLDFVISVYDSDIAHGFLQSPPQTPETLSAFFLCILGLLEANSRWGALLKCKNVKLGEYEFILPKGAEIVGQMGKLMAQGRLVELDLEVSPITATACSNLAVCYVFNSAGTVSGIYGYRAVHWDCVGLKHPFYSDSSQRFLYSSLEEMERAIVTASLGDKTIGDFTKWRQEYNYFEDYDGDRKIAWFIQRYMEKVMQREDAVAVMDSVAKEYIRHFGVSEEFFKTEQKTFGVPPDEYAARTELPSGRSSCC